MADESIDVTAETPESLGDQLEEQTSDLSEEPSGSGESAQSGIFDPAILESNPELRPLAEKLEQQALEKEKSFQADYTRKTQELANMRRQLEPLQQLLYDPQVGPQITAKLLGHPVPGQQQAQEPAIDLESASTDEIVGFLKNEISKQARAEAQQTAGQLVPTMNQLANFAFKTEADRVEQQMSSKYKDYDKHRPTINAQLMQQNPSTGRLVAQDLILNGQLETAADMLYKQLAFPDVDAEVSKRASEKIRQKKSANLASSSTPASGVTQKQKSIQMGDTAAFMEIAKRNLKRSG